MLLGIYSVHTGSDHIYAYSNSVHYTCCCHRDQLTDKGIKHYWNTSWLLTLPHCTETVYIFSQFGGVGSIQIFRSHRQLHGEVKDYLACATRICWSALSNSFFPCYIILSTLSDALLSLLFCYCYYYTTLFFP